MSEQQQKTIEDDEDLMLPEDTLAILQAFLAEKAEREKLAESDPAASLVDSNGEKPTFHLFEENWVIILKSKTIYIVCRNIFENQICIPLAIKSVLVQ